jgi:hypothetical protein
VRSLGILTKASLVKPFKARLLKKENMMVRWFNEKLDNNGEK